MRRYVSIYHLSPITRHRNSLPEGMDSVAKWCELCSCVMMNSVNITVMIFQLENNFTFTYKNIFHIIVTGIFSVIILLILAKWIGSPVVKKYEKRLEIMRSSCLLSS